MPNARRTPAKRAPARRASVSAHEAQAAGEGVAATGKVAFFGAEFRVAERVGIAPMILLAVQAKKGTDNGDPEGLVALHDMISDCIDEGDYQRFWRHAIDCKADANDLQRFVKSVMETLSARPTGSPGGSSAGRQNTSASSKGSSSATGTAVPEGMVSVDSLLAR